MPGIIGGFVSAVVAAVYKWPSTLDAYTPDSTNFPQIDTLISQPYKQGALQIAATFCSIGIALGTAIITGLALRLVYNWNENEFFNDAVYFEEAEEFLTMEEFHPEFVKKEIKEAAEDLRK